MSQASTLGGQCTAKFLSTGLLIFFGVGYAAALKVVGASFGQWEISVVWGLRVAVAICLTAGVSSVHLNPAATVTLWLFARFGKHKVTSFIVSQAAGVFCTAALVYGLYYNLFFGFEWTHHIVRGSVKSVDLAGTFSTYPNLHINFVQAFIVGMVITTTLMGLILALTDDGNGVPRSPLTSLLIGPLTTVIGTSMGPLTGFAMNPAHNFGPKVLAWLAGWGNVTLTGGRDTPCFLVPPFGPIVGVIVGAFAYHGLIGRHLFYDTCVVEKKGTTTPSEQKVSL